MRALIAPYLIVLVKNALSLVCYDASIVQRDARAAIAGPISTTSLQNDCKVCLTLTVTQELGPDVDANLYPIKMIRRTCGTPTDSSCAEGRYSCPLDETTFQRPKFILYNHPVPVTIGKNAVKQCECCDSDFCNGPLPDQPIPCNVTEKISDDELKRCVGCMTERQTTWTGKYSEITKCLSTGCENYKDNCSPCTADEFEKCSCSCSINFPKIGYFNTSFVVPNKRTANNYGSKLSQESGYEVSDAQARMTNACTSPNNIHLINQIFSQVVIIVTANCFFL